MKKIILFAIVCIFCLVVYGCKSDFLDAKPDKSLTIPRSIADLQALLDNSDDVMNTTPYLGLLGSDDVYISDLGMVPMTQFVTSAYTWEKDFYSGLMNGASDWIIAYRQVFYANIVLEAIEQLDGAHVESDSDQLRGAAFFFRAFAFFELAQLFCKTYDVADSKASLGIPLRLQAAVDIPSSRATVEETYLQILQDLEQAANLLPEVQLKLTRPTKYAAYALLARVYLVMGKYEEAEKYATAVLQEHPTLLDYNTLNPNSTRPFPVSLRDGGNPEVIFYSVMGAIPGFQISAEAGVDTALCRSYQENDLRKGLFFRKRSAQIFTFKGQYSGAGIYFTGLSVDELYLIRAESRVRRAKVQEAINDLNTLLITRFKQGTYVNFSDTDPDSVLNYILSERRKQLVFRGLRWSDLRRLNKESATSKTLIRMVQGKQITLPAGDPKFVLAIPPDVMRTTNMEQNPR